MNHAVTHGIVPRNDARHNAPRFTISKALHAHSDLHRFAVRPSPRLWATRQKYSAHSRICVKSPSANSETLPPSRISQASRTSRSRSHSSTNFIANRQRSSIETSFQPLPPIRETHALLHRPLRQLPLGPFHKPWPKLAATRIGCFKGHIHRALHGPTTIKPPSGLPPFRQNIHKLGWWRELRCRVNARTSVATWTSLHLGN